MTDMTKRHVEKRHAENEIRLRKSLAYHITYVRNITRSTAGDVLDDEVTCVLKHLDLFHRIVTEGSGQAVVMHDYMSFHDYLDMGGPDAAEGFKKLACYAEEQPGGTEVGGSGCGWVERMRGGIINAITGSGVEDAAKDCNRKGGKACKQFKRFSETVSQYGSTEVERNSALGMTEKSFEYFWPGWLARLEMELDRISTMHGTLVKSLMRKSGNNTSEETSEEMGRSEVEDMMVSLGVPKGFHCKRGDPKTRKLFSQFTLPETDDAVVDWSIAVDDLDIEGYLDSLRRTSHVEKLEKLLAETMEIELEYPRKRVNSDDDDDLLDLEESVQTVMEKVIRSKRKYPLVKVTREQLTSVIETGVDVMKMYRRQGVAMRPDIIICFDAQIRALLHKLDATETNGVTEKDILGVVEMIEAMNDGVYKGDWSRVVDDCDATMVRAPNNAKVTRAQMDTISQLYAREEKEEKDAHDKLKRRKLKRRKLKLKPKKVA
jgi:hypothetical protein